MEETSSCSSACTAPLLCSDLAINKAWTAAAYGLPTNKWYDHVKNDAPLLHGLVRTPRLVIVGGGVPIRVNGAVVGAIGGSGGHYSHDHAVAEAGIAQLA